MPVEEKFASGVHVLPVLPPLAADLYIAFAALIANLVVAFAGTGLLRLFGARTQSRLLAEEDYEPAERAASA